MELDSTPTKDICLEPCGQELSKLCKTRSLDLTDYNISGQSTLPNDNVVVVEIIPDMKAEANDPVAVDEDVNEEADKNQSPWLDNDDNCLLRLNRKSGNSQQSLVKNLREKFQNLSSYT